MSLVVALIALIICNYHQLIARFPQGGGAAAAAGAAFGEGWTFIPIGALIVDFVLTIAISVAAAASAVIAYVPSIADLRIPLALVVLVAVGGLTWFGHLGRGLCHHDGALRRARRGRPHRRARRVGTGRPSRAAIKRDCQRRIRRRLARVPSCHGAGNGR